jgi:hypothetical protein
MQEGDRYLGWPADSLVEVEGVLVDLPAVKGIAHRCDRALCASSGSCCASHDVWLGRSEAERALAVLDGPGAACKPELAGGPPRASNTTRRVGPRPSEAPGCKEGEAGDAGAEHRRCSPTRQARRCSRPKPAGVVLEALRALGPDTFAVRRGASGLCAFAFRDGDGRVLCTVHAAALRRGTELRQAKPLCCLLWPLSLTRSRPAVLSVQEGAFRYPCNRPRPAEERGLDEGIAEVLRQAFGPAFADAVQDACSGRCT